MTFTAKMKNAGKFILKTGVRIGEGAVAVGADAAGFMKRNWKGTISVFITGGVATYITMNPTALSLITESVLFGAKPFAFLSGIQSFSLATAAVAGLTFTGCMAVIALVSCCIGIDRYMMGTPVRKPGSHGSYKIKDPEIGLQGTVPANNSLYNHPELRTEKPTVDDDFLDDEEVQEKRKNPTSPKNKPPVDNHEKIETDHEQTTTISLNNSF